MGALKTLCFCAAVVAAVTAPATELVYNCDLDYHVDAIYPKGMSVDDIVDKYYRGFEESATRVQVEKILKLRGKPLKFTTQLVQKSSGDDYSIQLPGVGLPDGDLVKLHELFLDGVLHVWSTFPRTISDAGQLQRGWKDSNAPSPLLHTLFGVVPPGKPLETQKLGPNATALLETNFSGFGKDSSEQVGQRYFVISYTDSNKRSIASISGYWNQKSHSPAYTIAFRDSQLEGNAHHFSSFTLSKFKGGHLETRAVFKPIKRSEHAGFDTSMIEQGQMFVDKRLGEGRHYTFNFDGKIPSEDEVRSILAQSAEKAEQESSMPLIQFVAGGAFVGLGLFMWARARRSS